MKLVLTLVALLSLFALLIQAQQNLNLNIKPFLNNASCRRDIEVNKSDSDKTIRFVSKSKCLQDRRNSTSIGTFSEMEFWASVTRFPIIGMRGKTVVKIEKLNKELQVVIASAFGVDRIIEYVESSGVPGYQPGNDTLIRSYSLAAQSWKIVDLSKTPVDGSNTSFVYQAITEATITGCCTVRLSAVISSRDVQISSPKFVNRAGIVQVLTPSSLKVSFEIADIKYVNSNSLLALSTLVSFRGKRREKDASENRPLPASSRRSLMAGTAAEQPDDVNADQHVSQFDNDINTQLGGNAASLPKPFFSFQNFISRYNTSSPTIVTRSRLIQHPFVPIPPSTFNNDENNLRDFLNVGDNAVIARFFVSLTERVENFVWDPSVGSSDDTSSVVTGASMMSATTNASLIGMLIAIVMMIIM